jgi:HAP1 N-terminal conserved region.
MTKTQLISPPIFSSASSQKEKDLELTARIGKELLATNQKLENTVAALDNELRAANENITQLNYELSQKNELITILTNDAQESEDETGKSWKNSALGRQPASPTAVFLL